MRVIPIGFAFNKVGDVLDGARASAEVTHNHPEGIRGAQATAMAIYLARTGLGKPEIKARLEYQFGYDLSRKLDDIRPACRVDDCSCEGTVPPSIIAFLEAEDFEDAVRNAISFGGDTDTMACIAGGIADAYYGGIPAHIRNNVLAILDERLRTIVMEFMHHFPSSRRV